MGGEGFSQIQKKNLQALNSRSFPHTSIRSSQEQLFQNPNQVIQTGLEQPGSSQVSTKLNILQEPSLHGDCLFTQEADFVFHQRKISRGTI